MKNLIELGAAIKSQAAMFFGGAVFLYVVIGWWLGYEAFPFLLLVQIAILSMICATMQYLCFVVDKKHRPAERVVGFLIIMYLAISAFAYFGAWFEITMIAWLIFTGLFLLFSGIMFAVFGAYFHITGTRYNHLLNLYKARHAGEA